MAMKPDAGKQLFADKGAEKLYETVVSKGRAKIGAAGFALDPKQTCVHVTAGKVGIAYAGLHPRKNAMLLNLRLHEPLKSKRIRKVEQISKNRYNCEVILSSESEVDAEIVGWLQDAYQAASK
jgi:hypothetical protein